MPKKPENNPPKKWTPVYMSEGIQGLFRDYQNARIQGLDEAIREATKGLFVEESGPTWPPEIVEWVRTEAGIEPESNDPAQKNRTDFETALQLLLRERTGYDLKDLEDGLPASEYVQLALVAARIKGYREKAGATPDKVEVKANGIPKAAADTWVKRFGVKGAKWEDISITVAPGGTVVTFIPTSQKIIETWDPGFLTRREGRLLQDFQETATLKGEKNHVSILRTALIKVSGISEDPFTCEGGLYTRRFSMGDLGTGAVSEHAAKSRRGRMSDDDDDDEGDDPEEYFGDGYQIRTARRR